MKVLEKMRAAGRRVFLEMVGVGLVLRVLGARAAAPVRKAVMFLRVSAVAVGQVYRRLYRAQKEALEPAQSASRDPEAPMSRREAIVYVQHLAIEHLEEQLPGIRKAGKASTVKRDQRDAELVVEEGFNVIEALRRSNEVLMRDGAKVKPATAEDLRNVTSIGKVRR